jgi:hypothetical protein
MRTVLSLFFVATVAGANNTSSDHGSLRGYQHPLDTDPVAVEAIGTVGNSHAHGNLRGFRRWLDDGGDGEKGGDGVIYIAALFALFCVGAAAWYCYNKGLCVVPIEDEPTEDEPAEYIDDEEISVTHMQNTTGLDRKARAKFVYSDTCQQCGDELTAKTHVAAHIINPLGEKGLTTTCKKCNQTRNASSPEGSTFRIRRSDFVAIL